MGNQRLYGGLQLVDHITYEDGTAPQTLHTGARLRVHLCDGPIIAGVVRRAQVEEADDTITVLLESRGSAISPIIYKMALYSLNKKQTWIGIIAINVP